MVTRGGPLGYSSRAAACEAERARAESARRLRELVARHGLSVEVSWDNDYVRAIGAVRGQPREVVTRALCRSWESRGWAVPTPVGKGIARLDVIVEAMPEEAEASPD